MELGFRDVEAMLLTRHGIAEDRRIALRGRLEHLRKLGCPVGVQTGKGRPAVFGWSHLIQLALALDLVNLGITPEHAANVIKTAHRELDFHGASIAFLNLPGRELAKAANRLTCPFEKSVFLTIDVGGLSGLRVDGTLLAPSVGVMDGTALLDDFQHTRWTNTAQVIIDLGTLVVTLISLVSTWAKSDVTTTATDFSTWATDHVHP